MRILEERRETTMVMDELRPVDAPDLPVGVAVAIYAAAWIGFAIVLC